MRRSIYVLLSIFLFIHFNCFSTKKLVHSRTSATIERERERTRARIVKRAWACRVLNGIFDKKTVRCLVGQHGVDMGYRVFRRKNFSKKIIFLHELAPAIARFRHFPKKQKSLASFIDRCIRGDFESPKLLRVCEMFLRFLVDDIEDIKMYDLIDQSFGRGAKKVAFQCWLPRCESLKMDKIIRPFLKYFYTSGYGAQMRFDLFLFLQNFEYLKGYLRNQRYADDWERKNKKIVVDKYTAKSLKLMIYLWGDIRGKLKPKDMGLIYPYVFLLHEKLVIRGVKHFFSRCCDSCRRGD